MPDPLYAQDYVRSAQMTGLAYEAKSLQSLPSGITGQQLANALRNLAEIEKIFANDAEIDQFASQYAFIRAEGTGNQSSGPDLGFVDKG